MRKLILLVHVSLDGYVASENGSFDQFAPGKDNLKFVCGLTADADALLVGRHSYQLLQAYWPTAYRLPQATSDEVVYSQWYNAAQKIVVTKTLPETKESNTVLLRENIAEQIASIKNKPGKNILMFSSPSTFPSLQSAGIIDAYCVIVYPVIFGKGIPLFRPSENSSKLQLLTTTQLSNGEMALSYSVVK